MMTLVSSANNMILIQNLFSGEGHLYRLLTREALELIVRGTHVLMYPSQRKNSESNYMILLQISVF